MSDFASSLDLAHTLAVGRPMLARLSVVGSQSFGGSAELQALYTDVFAQLVAEAETVPGYGTSMAMLIERYAFVWVTQRQADLDEVPLNPRDYDQLILRFRQLWDGMLKARDDRQADAQFRHSFISSVMRVITEVTDELLEPEQARLLNERLVRGMAAIEVQGTETKRRN